MQGFGRIAGAGRAGAARGAARSACGFQFGWAIAG
ncbi:MAG: hypothetical protein JWP04_2912, partial [Belnapia sp.]|nr:hypothetical protein [Belnapia sp.]